MPKILRAVCLVFAVLVLGACQKTSGSVYGNAATSGVEHTEPVQFNGQRYQVTFRYESSFSGYNVSVRRLKTPLRNNSADQNSSVEVMTSALKHFACANGQKAKVTSDGAAYTVSQAWALKARCA